MKHFVKIISTLFLFYSCQNSHETQNNTHKIPSDAELKQKIVEANKMYIKRESDEIDQYIKLRGWDMITTGTGLRYMIIEKGKGRLAQSENEVTINYKLSLLDGTICYSSEDKGPLTFLVNKDIVESGLHEGIQYLHAGDKSLFIIPSHLAHGLLGDDENIPARATIVYELELMQVK